MSRSKNEAYSKAFSKNLRLIRKEKKTTLQKMANACKLDLATIQRIEKTNGNITICTLLELAKGLGIHPSELLNFDHSKFLRN